MSDPQDPVEALLMRMKPAPMSNDLMARLTAARPTETPKRSRAWHFLSRWVLPASAAACAALITVKVLDFSHEKKPTASASTPAKSAGKSLPVIVQDHMLQAREMGVMVGPNRQPYKVMEYQWTEAETILSGPNVPSVRLETTHRQIVPEELEIY